MADLQDLNCSLGAGSEEFPLVAPLTAALQPGLDSGFLQDKCICECDGGTHKWSKFLGH